MRDRMKRIVVLPFSIGCVSKSSVAVGANHTKKPKLEAIPSIARESIAGDKMKNLLLALPKPNISAGLQRLIKSFKSFSNHILVYKDEDEEMDIEMEIGFPTDVKHVTHIGWDGSATTNSLKGWDNLKAPEMISFPNLSLRQFELAMAAQADESLLARSSVVS